ncbi:MAG: tyrosine-protein phosphatase [Actinomycetota bacterium]|nr:tyrosine-protein phosphatase [Actinomycetota bacterium]
MSQFECPALTAEVPNFRDLGGVPAGSGREFRRGVIFRSQALTGLSDEAQAELIALGLTHVVDLRMERERIDLPVTVPSQIRVVIADVIGDSHSEGAAAAGQASSAAGTQQSAVASPPGGVDMMIETYRNFIQLDAAQRAYGGFARAVLASDGSLAVYCAAGKDRTGWAAAFLQNFAGVDEATAIEEYAKSNTHLVSRYAPRIESVRAAGGDLEAFKALVNANPDYLAAAFEHMRALYGNIEGYMAKGLGLTPQELVLLESRVVTNH